MQEPYTDSGATADGRTLTQEERGTKAESASRAVLNRVIMPRSGRAAMPFEGRFPAMMSMCTRGAEVTRRTASGARWSGSLFWRSLPGPTRVSGGRSG